MEETLYTTNQMMAFAEAPLQTPTHYYREQHSSPIFLTNAVWTGIFALIAFLVW